MPESDLDVFVGFCGSPLDGRSDPDVVNFVVGSPVG